MFDGGKNFLLVSLSISLLGGCAMTSMCGDNSGEVRLFRTPTEFLVNQGIKNYEDGNYSASLSVLQGLVARKDASKNEKILAYKYLAFTHCISPNESKDTRERMCRDSFKKAFDLDPAFDLSPAEAGHPIWGPIFSSVKNTPKK